MDIKVLCLDLFMQYITKPYLDLVKHPYWNFFCENIYIIVNVQNVWDKVFKNEPSKLCGRQLLKNLKWYGLLKQTSRPFCFKFFKGCLPQILLKCQQRFLTGFKIRLCTQPAFTCSKLTIENTKTRYEICSMLTMKTPERR